MYVEELMRVLKSKRGVSPLIATVLLIAFAVSLGAVVMSWGSGYIEDQAESAKTSGNLQMKCSQDIALNVKSISGVKRLCYRNISTNGYVDFILENKGTKQISGVSMNIIGSNDEIETWEDSSFSITGGGVKKGTATYDYDTVGAISQVEFIPMVTIADQAGIFSCTNNKLVDYSLTRCS